LNKSIDNNSIPCIVKPYKRETQTNTWREKVIKKGMKVIGTCTGIKNGYVEINATVVMSKWDNDFIDHPTSCACSALVGDCSIFS